MKYQKGSFITIPNKTILSGKKPSTQAVFNWLCDHANQNGFCFPRRSLLAEKAGVSISTVDSAIKELVTAGILEKVSRVRDDGSQTSNGYQILLLEAILPDYQLPEDNEEERNGYAGGPNSYAPGPNSYAPLTQPSELNSINSLGELRNSQENDHEDRGEVDPKLGFPLPVGFRWDFDAREEVDVLFDASGRKVSKAMITALRNAYNKVKGVPQEPKNELLKLFYLFKELNPAFSLWHKNKTERQCGEELLSKFPLTTIEKALGFYKKNKDNRFCPKTNSPYSLLNNWSSLQNFRDRLKNEDE